MFGKRRTPGAGAGAGSGLGSGSQGSSPGGGKPGVSHGTSHGTAHGGEAHRPSAAGGPAGRSRSLQDTRRPAGPPSRGTRHGEPGGEPAVSSAAEGRTLVVGQGIRLSGEIKRCETLVVEGEVEANLTDCLSLEINDSGLFKGSAVVEQAEISGRLAGELTVKGCLFVRASGHLQGSIRYADLEIERGGRIAGSVEVIEPPAAEQAATDDPLPGTAGVADTTEPGADQGETPNKASDPAEAPAGAPSGAPSGARNPAARNAAGRSDATAKSEALI